MTKNQQVWEFNLTDDDGDGVWTGEVEIIPSQSGKAQLRVTAYDGLSIDYMSIDVEFVEKETDNSSMYFAVGVIGGFVVISGLVILLVMRRRRRLADLDLIDSWGVFGEDNSESFDENLN